MRRRRILQVFMHAVLAIILSQSYESFSQNPESRISDSLFKRYTQPTENRVNSSYYIYVGKEMVSFKAKLVRRLSEEVQIIRIDNPEQLGNIAPGIKIASAHPDWKLSPSLENSKAKLIKENKTQSYVLVGEDLEKLQEAIKRLNVSIIRIDRGSSSLVVSSSSKNVLENLLHLPELIFIDQVHPAHSETSIIGYDRSFHGINTLDYLLPGINGNNIVVSVKEQNIEGSDIDLYQRILASPLAAPTTQPHANVIASIIGGAGNTFYDGRGMANHSRFFSSSFANLFADDEGILLSSKVSVQNHSYGTVPQQFYGAEAASYDQFSWRNKNFIHVFSSGNRGTQSATEGQYASIPGFANQTGNFKMAKNVITVGAIDNLGNIAGESSAGPTYDGRIAPQLVALGPNGTSDAAAVVSGTIALIQQAYADSNQQKLPPASLVKAILYNTAEDVNTTGIDFKTGYGEVNSYKAVKAILKKSFYSDSITHNQQWTKTISIPSQIALLKLTLCWTDSAAAVNTNKALVNDLDIELREINTGIIYRPWILNTKPQIDSLRLLPVRGRDSLNTAEQISLNLPSTGNYEIRVVGKSIINGKIPFHVAYSLDTLNRFEFLSPQHSSDVNRSETERIFVRWATAVADTNQTGKLSISYDGGSTWNFLIQPKLYTGRYYWTIKDTVSRAQFKMETGFGNFFSKEFVIGPVTRPRLDFYCNDSIQISWNKHIYASSYNVYVLGNSPYMEILTQTTDTFKVFKTFPIKYLIYAIEPVLSNQIPAMRSIAFNIDFQGVNCFYRTLNYTQLDANSLNLVLDLSTNRYVDSIYFEVVNSAGVLLKTVGGQRAGNTSLVYTQLVSNLSRGTSYFRARIRLSSGQEVFTNIISVTSSGNQQILFFPNPVSKNTNLQYVLQQGVPGDCSLWFYDVTGRLIKSYPSIPATINTSFLPKGLIIYKLIYPDGKLAETGKVLVQ